jgi:hypothetical protein
MKKLMLWLFIYYPFLVLNAQQQHTHDVKTVESNPDSIFVLKSDTSYSTFKNPIQFNSFIQLRVHGLSKLFQLSAEKKKPVNLFLDGIEMKGIVPVGMDKSKEVLFFILHSDSASMKQWQLVRRIIIEEKKKELLVSVGLEGEEAYPSSLRLSAELSRTIDYYLAILSYFFAIILFTFLVKRSNTLRKNRQVYTDAYSLSKTLIAFWIFIILFSLLFLLTSINTFPHVTISVLLILLITMVSSLIAMSIDYSRYYTSSHRTVSNSKTFAMDLISDSKGINIFCLQLILTTIITGSYFIVSVISEMLLPVFDTYFLVLFGISHLIYLLFKWFEKTNRL